MMLLLHIFNLRTFTNISAVFAAQPCSQCMQHTCKAGSIHSMAQACGQLTCRLFALHAANDLKASVVPELTMAAITATATCMSLKSLLLLLLLKCKQTMDCAHDAMLTFYEKGYVNEALAFNMQPCAPHGQSSGTVKRKQSR
jgi:hypothetical protein